MYEQMQDQEFKDVEAAGEIMGAFDDLQQTFILKVYSTIAIQLLLTTVGVAAVVISIQPLAYFLLSNGIGPSFYGIICTAALVALSLLYMYNFANYFMLVVLTAALTFLVGLTCAVTSGEVIFGSAILTSAIILNLTLYTFRASTKGYNFNFLRHLLFGAIVVIMVLASVQIIYPMGKIFVMMYGCFGSIAFCSYIVCVTDSVIIKSNVDNDRFIWAAVTLYVDYINLFLLLLTLFKAVHS